MPNGSVLIVSDGFVIINLSFIAAHIGGVTSVEYLDNNRIVSIGDDRTVKVWQLAF
jgi:WD40 repeat protein